MLPWLEVALALTCCQAPPKDAALDQIEEFRRFYRPTRTTHEKVEAIHVLDKLDRSTAVEPLLEACGDAEFPVREAALQVLSSYRSDEVKQLLRKVAADEKRTRPGQRSGAIQALGRIGDLESLDLLIANLKLNDFELKRASVVALGQLHQNAAAEPLVAL